LFCCRNKKQQQQYQRQQPSKNTTNIEGTTGDAAAALSLSSSAGDSGSDSGEDSDDSVLLQRRVSQSFRFFECFFLSNFVSFFPFGPFFLAFCPSFLFPLGIFSNSCLVINKTKIKKIFNNDGS
jgi:hypothetical protein